MKSIVASKVMKEGAKRRIKLPLKRKANVESEEESDSEDLEDAWISSEDSDSDTDQDTDEEVNPEEIDLEPGYYIVDYEKELFPGKVEEKQAGNLIGFTVSCMQKANLPGSIWKWPYPDDKNTYPRCDIKQRIDSPVMIRGGQNGVIYKEPELIWKW